MFENIKTITISGGFYDQPTTLRLFNDNQCLNILYGRNGSGKTTIAKAMRQLVDKDTELQTDEGYVSYFVSTDAILPDEKKSSVFIFDEEFIRENVRIKGNGLESIVMMGEQVELDELIAEKEEILTKLDNKLRELNKECEKFNNPKEIISPLFHFNKIREALRADGGWADTDRDIKGNSVKSKITEDVVTYLLSLSEPDDNCETIQTRVNNNLKLYKESKNAQEITWVKKYLTLPLELDNLNALLTQPLDIPKLSERERRLLALLVQHSQHSTDNTKKLLAEDWSFCPLCLREITIPDKEYIHQTLTHILNEEATKYEELLNIELQNFSTVEIIFPKFSGSLNEQQLKDAQIAVLNLNGILQTIQEKINQRKSDIYSPLESPFSDDDCETYRAAISTLGNALDAINECVRQFNISVKERKNLCDRIREDNFLLARKLHSSILKDYKLSKENSIKNKNEIVSVVEECERIRKEIKTLKAQAESVDIALDYINDGLKYVFYSNIKANLVAGEGCYKLKINGRHVPPKKISVGERNVLGLCYFFAKLFSNKKKDNKYKDEMLIIIDDPVSSFDYGNRLGVMSLLRHQFINIKHGNSNSRILVLTHDLRTAFDLVKIRSELNNGKRGEKKFFELVNKQIRDREISNEYKRLLEYVYNYAKNPTDDEMECVETGIGNVMRRVIEAFSSFCYNMNFEEMMCREGILNAIPRDKRHYYENFMCRLTLNGESHMEERVYGLDTMTPYFTKQEKIQTAKSLLLFLYYINEEHLACYFAPDKHDREDKISEIKSWMKDEATWLNND